MQYPPQQPSMPPYQPQYPPQQQAPQFSYPQPPMVGQPMMPPQQQYQQPMMQQPGYAPYPQQPYMQPQVMVNNVNVQVGKSGPGFLVRALYFIFIGSWLGFFWLQIGYALCVFIVTLPLGLMMLNRLPQVLTLKGAGPQATNVNVQSVAIQPGMPGAPGVMVNNVNVSVGTQQTSFLVRALYFVFIGWWLGYMWACLGYALCIFIITLPLGLIMLNNLPMIITLRKN